MHPKYLGPLPWNYWSNFQLLSPVSFFPITLFFFFFFNHTVFNSFHEGKDWSLPYLLALSTIFFFFLIWLHWVLGKARGIFVVVCMIFSCSMWDLVPWPGIEPWTPAFGAWSITTGPPEKSHNILNMVKS